MTSDLDIANAARLLPISDIAAKLGIPEHALVPYGAHKAKISLDYIAGLPNPPSQPPVKQGQGRLILVTAISPTPPGEGKTTTSVGLTDALNRVGKNAAVCLRQPSMGPTFGAKGGATGGGHAQVVPMADINLHFTGDIHAVGAANNLLAAMVDNHLHWNSDPALDPDRIVWRRAVDMNDRALRQIRLGGGAKVNGPERDGAFAITVASEVMAIFCLSHDVADLQRRLGKIIIGYGPEGRGNPVYARDLKADGAMAVILKDALMPNLVQTLEGSPAFIHGGPFANIAHGCNSIMATRTALNLADYVVTEAGFGADLGAEKFFDIKCRKSGLQPDAVVLVATLRAIKYNGGADPDKVGDSNPVALRKGFANLLRHARNLRGFGVPLVVGLNQFSSDTADEMEDFAQLCAEHDLSWELATHWADGGRGAEALAHKVIELAESGTADMTLLYPDNLSLWEKVRHVATEYYGAADIEADQSVRDIFEALQQTEAAAYPVCMAKTQVSFSADPKSLGAPEGFILPIGGVRVSNGAEFVVVECGNIMIMPGLSRVPAATRISLDDSGRIIGLS